MANPDTRQVLDPDLMWLTAWIPQLKVAFTDDSFKASLELILYSWSHLT